jgi:hypothetical protein
MINEHESSRNNAVRIAARAKRLVLDADFCAGIPVEKMARLRLLAMDLDQLPALIERDVDAVMQKTAKWRFWA